MKGKCKIQVIRDNKVINEIEQENLITNAISNLINPNYPDFFCTGNNTSFNPLSLYTPIALNSIGGIMLFNETRTATSTHIYPNKEDMKSYLGSAGNNAFTSTSSKFKGGLNELESKALDNGYKFVWDFKPKNEEYVIKSLSLTSAAGGQSGLDADVTNDKSLLGSNFNYYGGTVNKKGQNANSEGKGDLTNVMATSKYILYYSDDYKTLILGELSTDKKVLTLKRYTYSTGININNQYALKEDKDVCNNWELQDVHYINAPFDTIPAEEEGKEDTIIEYDFQPNLQRFFWDDTSIYSINFTKSGTNLNIDAIIISLNDFSTTYGKYTIEIGEAFNIDTISINKNYSNFYIFVSSLNKLYKLDLHFSVVDSKVIPYNWNNANGVYTDIIFINDLIYLITKYGNNSLGYARLVDLEDEKYFDLPHCMTSTNVRIGLTYAKETSFNNLLYTYHIPYGVNNHYNNIFLGFFNFYFASILNLSSAISVGANDWVKIEYTITN